MRSTVPDAVRGGTLQWQEVASRRRHIAAIVFVCLIGIIVYWNSLDNQFVSDDSYFIVRNWSIRSLEAPFRFFTSLEAFSRGFTFYIYRPLATLSFALNFAVGGLDPFGYHVVNLALHVANGVALYFLLGLLLRDWWTSLLTTLLFVGHPIQTEAITWISGRSNGLFLLFILLSFYLYALGSDAGSRRKRVPLYWCSILLYAVALLSKEMAITLPLLLILYDVSLGNRDGSRDMSVSRMIRRSVPFFVVAALYIVVRTLVVGQAGQIAYWGGGPYPTFLTMCKGFVYYARLVFFPVTLSLKYFIPISWTMWDASVLLGLGLLGGWLALCGFAYARSKKVFFAAAWFPIALLPVSNIIPIKAIVGERFLYLPSIGVCMLVAMVVSWASGSAARVSVARRRAATFLFVLILLLYAVRGIARNTDWQNSFTLWSKTVKTAPESETAHYSLAQAYLENGRVDEAIAEFQEALRVEPLFPFPHEALGTIYLDRGLYDRAISQYMMGLRIQPMARLFSGLGLAYARKGHFRMAEEQFQRAVELGPYDWHVRYRHALVLHLDGKLAEAEEQLEIAKVLNPLSPLPYIKLGALYAERGQVQLAREQWEAALKISPGHEEATEKLRELDRTEAERD